MNSYGMHRANSVAGVTGFSPRIAPTTRRKAQMLPSPWAGTNIRSRLFVCLPHKTVRLATQSRGPSPTAHFIRLGQYAWRERFGG